MIYNQDDEENFLSDRRVGESNNIPSEQRRRGGAYQEVKSEKRIVKLKENEDNQNSVFSTIILVIALIVATIAVFVLFKVFTREKLENNVNEENKNSNTSVSVENNTNNNNKSNNSNSSTLGISNVNDMYNAYSIEIESVVYKKGGNFFNKNEKIEGDKAYIEYKQISGLKDSTKEEKINEKLKNLSIELYDKNYLSDKDTLFIDVHTKLSVNFNTLSYVVIKTYEDIDGKHKDEKVISYNIRLDNLEEIKFEDLFNDSTKIKNCYSNYVKGKSNKFYFDPKTIYIYDDKLNETKIDMSKNYENIAIYNRYKDKENIFKSKPTSKKVFTILESTVSEETKDRDFKKN